MKTLTPEDKWEIRAKLVERDGLICMWCRRALHTNIRRRDGAFATIEHVIPKCEGGTHDLANLGLACEPCNWGRKNSKNHQKSSSWQPKKTHCIHAMKLPPNKSYWDAIVNPDYQYNRGW